MSGIMISCRKCGAKNRVLTDKQHLGPKCGKCQAPLDLSGARSGVVEISDANFDSFMAATDQVVMVDFYSPTCGPCQSMSPVVEKLAQRYQGRAAVTKINSSINLAAASRFNIRGVPSFVFFQRGREVDRITGAVPEDILARKLDSLL